MGPGRRRQLVLLLAAAALCTADPEPEAARWRGPARRAAHRRSAFPGPDSGDWQPIGPGDPLSNAPTFQYAPPVLAQPRAEDRQDRWPVRTRNPPVRVVTPSGERRNDGLFGSFFQFRLPAALQPQNWRRPGGGLSYISGPQFGAPPSERRQEERGPPPPEYTEEEPPRLLAGQSNVPPPWEGFGQQEFQPPQQQFQPPQQQFEERPEFQQEQFQERPDFSQERPDFSQEQFQTPPQQFQERPDFFQEQNTVEPQRFEEPQQQFRPPPQPEQSFQPPPQQEQQFRPPQPEQFRPPQPEQFRPPPQEEQQQFRPPQPEQFQPPPQPQQQRPQPPPQPQPQPQPRPQPQPPQPRPRPQPQQPPQPQPEVPPQQEDKKEELSVEQRKDLIRQKLLQQFKQFQDLRRGQEQERRDPERREPERREPERREPERREPERREPVRQELDDQATEESKAETFVRAPPPFERPDFDRSPFVQVEAPRRQEILPPQEPSTTTQRVLITTTPQRRRPVPNRRRRPPFRRTTEATTTTTTERTPEPATRPSTTTTTTTTERQPPSTSASTTTTTTTTTERVQTTTEARTPPSTTGTTTRRTTTTERRTPPTTEREPDTRRRVPLSSLLGKRPSRPDPARFGSRPQTRPRPGLFQRPDTPATAATTTTEAATTTTTRRPTTTRPAPTTQRTAATTATEEPDSARQQLLSRLAELRATRRPRPSLVTRLPLSSEPLSRRPPFVPPTAAPATEPPTTTTSAPRPRRPTTERASPRPQPFFTPTSAPFPVQHTQTSAAAANALVAKAPYVHQSGYSKIKMFGINVHGQPLKKKPGQIYKKPIYPIHIESKTKTTTPELRTTTDAPTTVDRSETIVEITTPPTPSPTTTAEELAFEAEIVQPQEQVHEIPYDETYDQTYDQTYSESYDTAPAGDEHHDHGEHDEYGDYEGFTDDHAMMEKMYFEADGDPEVMEASGDGEHFHGHHGDFHDESTDHHGDHHGEHHGDFNHEEVDPETFGFPEFQYEAAPPPSHAFHPQQAVPPPLPTRRADHVTYREGDEPVPPPQDEGVVEDLETSQEQERPGPPQRPPRPAGASSWMTGLLSSLFSSRPRDPEPVRPAAPSPVSLLSGLFGAVSGGAERRPPPTADPYGFAPPPDNDPLAASASEPVAVTDANGEPIRPPAAFRNVPALAGLFAGLPASERPRFPAAARRVNVAEARQTTPRPVFFAKRPAPAASTESVELSHPFEYMHALHSLKGRLPEPAMVQEPTQPPQLVATRVPLE